MVRSSAQTIVASGGELEAHAPVVAGPGDDGGNGRGALGVGAVVAGVVGVVLILRPLRQRRAVVRAIDLGGGRVQAQITLARGGGDGQELRRLATHRRGADRGGGYGPAAAV